MSLLCRAMAAAQTTRSPSLRKNLVYKKPSRGREKRRLTRRTLIHARLRVFLLPSLCPVQTLLLYMPRTNKKKKLLSFSTLEKSHRRTKETKLAQTSARLGGSIIDLGSSPSPLARARVLLWVALLNRLSAKPTTQHRQSTHTWDRQTCLSTLQTLP